MLTSDERIVTDRTAIEVRRLRLRRGRFRLEIENLRVEPGELVVLIGRNGAGKSTLLDAIGGQITADRGQIEIFAREVSSMPARSRALHVSAIPQEFEVPFAFSVGEVVEFGRAPHLGYFGRMRSDDRAAVAAAIAECDLGRLADRPLGELSGGQRRRVALATALAQSTPVLLADEPSAHMDIARIHWCWRLLLKRARSGRAVLAAAHDLNIAAEFADRIYLLGGGKLICDGDPASVLNRQNLAAGFGVSAEIEQREGRPYLSEITTPRHAADRSDR
jgi:iron complex transport system ATP-binding protein